MKFINYLESITGISIYPMISLLLFASIFTLVLIYTFKQSKAQIDEQKNLPLNQ
ncbi:MAG: CcoQ/FixQ family Cbb3-type cytochrome c oxidase assembly chaperone [Flavobacteriales bacterium]